MFSDRSLLWNVWAGRINERRTENVSHRGFLWGLHHILYFHVDTKEFITRWRLEPKPQDVEKMKRGELVEPQKPIVYYIDPATPKQWRKYLIAGIEDWQKAFEQAGFKNAIMAKEWPENDSTMLSWIVFNIILKFSHYGN